jgi:2-keto-3-deoxy-L-rhamnonate aldolase RhmA
MLGQLRSPQVTEMVATIAKKGRQAGKYVGIGMGHDVEFALDAAKWGVQWIQCGNDFGYMVAFADQLYSQIRSRLTKSGS